MFASIRRHQNWVWYVVVVIIIVSFVIFFNPTSKYGGGGARADYNFGTIQGRPITRDEFLQAQAEAYLVYYFQRGQWPDSTAKSMGFDVERQTYNRLLLFDKLKTLNIEPGDEAAATWIKTLFSSGTGQPFSIDIYNAFVTNTLAQRQISAEQFELFAHHQVADMQLITLYGMTGGLVPPQEVEAIYRRENTPVLCDAVFFSTSNYLARIAAPIATLQSYYSNNISEYSIPDQMQVDYIRFAATNYLSFVDKQPEVDKFLTARSDQVYTQQGAAKFTDSKGNPLPAAQAKEKIRNELRMELALVRAHQDANSVLTNIVDAGAKGADLLNDTATKLGFQVKTSSLFDATTGPAEVPPASNFRRASFMLSPENPIYPSGVPTEDAYYVIRYRQKLPSRPRDFASIKDRVADDYKAAEALRLATLDGDHFVAAATNALAKGKSFRDLCAEQHVRAVPLPAFSPSTRSLPEIEERLSLGLLQSQVAGLAPGKVSSLITTHEGGAVVYVKSTQPLDEAKMKSELPTFAEDVRRRRQTYAYSEWAAQRAADLKIPASESTKKAATVSK